MKRIKDVKPIVACILEDDARTRDSDGLLYLKVLAHYAKIHDIDLGSITVPHFLLTLDQSPFPPFESVRRARQKLQREREYLASSETVAQKREEKKEEYEAFAREKR